MVKSLFVEDIFSEFCDLIEMSKINIQYQDISPIQSFHTVLITGELLTQSQGNFMLKLLSKYKIGAKAAGLDYLDVVDKLIWKNSFRVLDHSKRVFVEIGKDNEIIICMKFPFSIKEAFDKELGKSYGNSEWDADRKLRKLKFYNFNIMAVLEFAKKYEFEIDNTFLEAVSAVEEIWQEQDQILPHCVILDDIVVLKNAVEDAQEWWLSNATGNLIDDLLMAKSMGYPLGEGHTSNTNMDHIFKSHNNMFWFKNSKSVFEVYKNITSGVVAVVVDRSTGAHDWVRNFVKASLDNGIDRNDIKVCFRTNGDGLDKDFNQWVKDQGLGGSVDTGKILIFNSKPPKWVFTKNVDVKLIVTNNMYPSTSNLAQQWIDSHHCVFYIGDVKPSPKRNKQIVEL